MLCVDRIRSVVLLIDCCDCDVVANCRCCASVLLIVVDCVVVVVVVVVLLLYRLIAVVVIGVISRCDWCVVIVSISVRSW